MAERNWIAEYRHSLESLAVREIGTPVADRIITLAEDLALDRIVIGGRLVDPVGKAVFGSVAQDVIIGADCPVTLVGAPE